MVGNKKNYKKPSKERESINFRLDAFDDKQRQYFDETLGKVGQSPTQAIKRVVNLALKSKELKTELETVPVKEEKEEIEIIPNCGYSWNYEGLGIICLKGLRTPITKDMLKKRKLGNLVCELCPMIANITLEERQSRKLEFNLQNFNKPIADSRLQGKYNASKDIPLFVRKFKTLSPSILAKEIFTYKNKAITPQSITMWLKRHKETFNELKSLIEDSIPL